jgi:tetratricopeptide (TPR) repeat protein
MENIRLFLRLYFTPARAMSDILDRGSWFFAAMLVLLTGVIFFYGVNAKLDSVYRVPSIYEYYQEGDDDDEDIDKEIARRQRAEAAFQKANAERPRIPIIGDYFFKFFSFESTRFYIPLLSISIFYVPALILLLCFVGGLGYFSVVVRRDYAALAACTLMSWAAAHLPFGLAGLLLGATGASPQVYLAFWFASGLLFGILMLLALRTVFGTDYLPNIVTVGTGWLAMCLGYIVFPHISPWLFSPFLLIYAFMYLGGSIGSEVGGIGNAFRQRQNLKRFLHNATVNPRDADAHVQLGLIYKQRRQDALALEHFQKAHEIDADDVDANYELGKIARAGGELQKALDHFAVVVEQNDKHSVSEVWREIGATYLEAGMPPEARDALEKFVERRSLDPEGLYHLGMAFKTGGDADAAREKFTEAVEAAKIVPSYQRREAAHWRKLAQKEL